MELLYVIFGVTALGLSFSWIERQKSAGLRTFGPWLVVCAAVLLTVLAFPPTLDGSYHWADMSARYFVDVVLSTDALLMVFGVEAALVGRWLLRQRRGSISFMLWFTCVTVALWFATFLLGLGVYPRS